jgi:hypothetical protein
MNSKMACGDFEKIKELIERGGDINQVEYDDWHRQKIKELIENGADINRFYGCGMTRWSVADIHICKILLDNCPDMYEGDREYGVTPLWLASKYGYLDVVKLLIKKGVCVNQPTNDGRSPLCVASQYGHLDVVKYLIENGADIDQPNIHGATPLSGASEYGHLDVAKYLKKKGAK